MVEYVTRIIYKIVYFYVFPILVIPVGIFGWRMDNEVTRFQFAEVIFDNLDKEFHFDKFMQIYAYIIMVIFCIGLYGAYMYVSTTSSIDKNMNRLKDKI
jgi:choline-glycine betaine transporter